MGFKSLSAHSPFITKLIKSKLSQSFGLHYCPLRFSSSVCFPSSLQSDSTKLTRQLSSFSCLLSNLSSSSQSKLNHLSTRFFSHFVRIRQHDYRQSFIPNLLSSYLFGQQLVIDCDYDLNPVEAKKIVWDIHYTIKAISQQTEPFNLILTGPFNDAYKKVLRQVLVSSNPNETNLGIQTKEQHFLKIFDKQQIVYLSPYSTIPLAGYDNDTIYVLGGLPDIQSVNIRLGSSQKIKSLNLQSRRLPLDDHFIFKTTKRLSLFECVNILDHLSIHGNMAAALKHGVHPGRYKSNQELKQENQERTLRISKKSPSEIHNQVE